MTDIVQRLREDYCITESEVRLIDLQVLQHLCHKAADEIERLRQTRAFFASVIKSGEPWTEHCEQRMKP